MKMAENCPNGWKTLWEKEKLLVKSNFSFSLSVFKRLFPRSILKKLILQTCKNLRACLGKCSRKNSVYYNDLVVCRGLQFGRMYFFLLELTLYHTVLTFNKPKGIAFWKHCNQQFPLFPQCSLPFFHNVLCLIHNKFCHFDHLLIQRLQMFQFGLV